VLTFSAAVQFFVESADPGEVLACVGARRASGVITTAALVVEAARRAGREPRDLLREICGAVNGPVGVEVGHAGSDGGDREGMLREARDWAEVAGSVIVALPATEAGIEVIRACAAARIRTGVAVYPSPEQALAAARAGVAQVWAPFDRVPGADAGDGIRKLTALLRTFDLSTEVVVRAIRSSADIVDAALAGAR
jgi:transaldolase